MAAINFEAARQRGLDTTERLAHSQDLASRVPLLTRLVIKCFARRLNADLIAPVILRAHSRGRIDSTRLHEILAEFDPSQAGTVGYVVRGRP
jgi:hypothetical protein